MWTDSFDYKLCVDFDVSSKIFEFSVCLKWVIFAIFVRDRLINSLELQFPGLRIEIIKKLHFSQTVWPFWNIVPAMKGEKEIEMSDMKLEDEKETDIDAEIEKAEVKMVSFGELVR